MLASRLERALTQGSAPLLESLDFLGEKFCNYTAVKSRQCHGMAGMAAHSVKYCER